MIEALISGKVFGQPVQKTAKTGKPFALAKVRTADGGGESLLVSVIAFSESACSALLALGDGDAVAMAGTLAAKTWTDRDGNVKPALDLVASQVLTVYHAKRKREAITARPAQNEQHQGHQHRGEFDDDQLLDF